MLKKQAEANVPTERGNFRFIAFSENESDWMPHMAIIAENTDFLEGLGFEVEDFGNSTVIVRSSPQYIPAVEIEDCITEMSGYISQGKTDIFTEKMDWFYSNVACRSAIKAGNKSTPEELIGIVKHLEEHPEIKYCPHGRPICIVLTKGEIEKQFGRV